MVLSPVLASPPTDSALPDVEPAIAETIDQFTPSGWATPLTQVLRVAGLTSLELFSGISNDSDSAYISDMGALLSIVAPSMDIADVSRSLVLIRHRALTLRPPRRLLSTRSPPRPPSPESNGLGALSHPTFLSVDLNASQSSTAERIWEWGNTRPY